MRLLYTLLYNLPTWFGIPTDKEGTSSEQGEDAGEDLADHVIYHSNQKNLEKVRQTVNLCWDFTLGLPQPFSLYHGLFQGLLELNFMFMHLRVKIEFKLF